MSQKTIDLSVVIPTYNRFHRLPKLLQTITDQKFHPKEVIIVDDGSDKIPSEEHLRDHLSPLIPLKFLKNESNKGASARRNQGAKIARSEFLTFVDDDDYWLPHYLETVAELMTGHEPKPDVVYANGFAESDDGKRETRFQAVTENFLSSILKINFILSPGIIIRRSAFESVGGFDENLPSSQDWDLWVRLAKKYKFVSIDSPQVVHVEHGEARISNSPKRHAGYQAFYRKHFIDFLKEDLNLNYKLKAGVYCLVPSSILRGLKSLRR